jgi:thiol-disulfide isomerase/thioredoxin
MTKRSLACLLSVLPLLFACRAAPPAAATPSATSPTLAPGAWQAELASPGGQLGFALELGADGQAWLHNGEERIAIERVERAGSAVTFAMDHYDAAIEAELTADGALVGRWRKTTPEGQAELPFRARPGAGPRFTPPAPAPLAQAPRDLDGSWRVVMRDRDGESTAVGILRTRGHQATGTFLTPTGDYRYLAGDYYDGLVRLSAFDGAHAFLFHLRASYDGGLRGDFWSRDSYHATLVGTPLTTGTERSALPDPLAEVTMRNAERRLRFSFPSIDGGLVTDRDARFAGKVVVVQLFGTWCPNCNDAAPLLARWHRRYRERGLEVVGLAYEFTGDHVRDAAMVRQHRDKYELAFPLLLAGVSDKAQAAATLPDLSAVKSFPTTLFIGRDGAVARIYSGFAGPGTGRFHAEMVAELEAILEALLAAPAPR